MTEDGQASENGWAFIEASGWLLFLSDEDDVWQSWPAQHVRCIDWTYFEPVEL